MIVPEVTLAFKDFPVRDRRELSEAMKKIFASAGQFWADVLLPKHFTVAGGREYGYAKRSAKYMQQKSKNQGHQRPLVRTGVTEFTARGTAKVTSTSNKATIRMQVPAYFVQERKKGRSYDKAREMTAVSAADEKAIADHMDSVGGAIFNRRDRIYHERRGRMQSRMAIKEHRRIRAANVRHERTRTNRAMRDRMRGLGW